MRALDKQKGLGLYQTSPMRVGGAEDGIRTRDPHLGKVMLYH
jgi:hypothetical protein